MALKRRALAGLGLLLCTSLGDEHGALNGTRRHKQHKKECFAFVRFQLCCCKDPSVAPCWERGRYFLQCCSGRLAQCRGQRWPQLHVISFGGLNDQAVVLAHSVLHLLKTPLLLFGTIFDQDPLPYKARARESKALMRKVFLTKELLQEFPPEDYVLYLDATDTLVQRGGAQSLLKAVANIGSKTAAGFEPVVFAGQGHCHPFEVWADGNIKHKESDPFYAGTMWNPHYANMTYGYGGMGFLLDGPEDVCSRVKASGSLPFADSGTWIGQVASAQELFKIMEEVATTERAGHCMEMLKLVQAWFPGLSIVDSERDLFWTTELELNADEGWKVSEAHPAVQYVKQQTERSLCVAGGPRQLSYWDGYGPSPFKSGGLPPFVLHYAGPAKGFFAKRCAATYTSFFIGKDERWFLRDLDRKSAVRLSRSKLGALDRAIQDKAVLKSKVKPGTQKQKDY